VIPPGSHSEIRIRFRSDDIFNFEGFAVNVTFSPYNEIDLGNITNGMMNITNEKQFITLEFYNYN